MSPEAQYRQVKRPKGKWANGLPLQAQPLGLQAHCPLGLFTYPLFRYGHSADGICCHEASPKAVTLADSRGQWAL